MVNMDKNDFDQFAEDYNAILDKQLNFFEGDSSYFAEYKIIKLKSLLTASPKTILDFGCGVGRSAQFLQQYFPESSIHGCELSKKSLEQAEKILPAAEFFLSSELSVRPKTYDLVFVSNVFHHIPPAERLTAITQIANACQPGASVVIFEHNPYNPLTRHLVNTCPFDEDAVLLKPKELKSLFQQAGIKNINLTYTLFFPAFLKRLRFLEKYLGFLPLGGQYLVSGNV
jgi:SAM-dependent methyltransferase